MWAMTTPKEEAARLTEQIWDSVCFQRGTIYALVLHALEDAEARGEERQTGPQAEARREGT